MAVMSDGGPGGWSFLDSPAVWPSLLGAESKSGSINVDPRNIVLARIEKNRIIWPSWKRSHWLALLNPPLHWN